MLIYDRSIELVASVCKLSRRVQEHDRDLARQMRRAVTSVPLNMQAAGPSASIGLNEAFCER